MQSTAHTMDQLFDRLGLPSGELEIDNFIERKTRLVGQGDLRAGVF